MPLTDLDLDDLQSYRPTLSAPAEIEVWQFADHGGGYASTPPKQFAWLAERGLAPKNA